ncbi:MAG TPA: hypothetical protein VGG09_03910 [Acidimicrobiales bacterium]
MADDGTNAEPEVTTKVELDACLAQAQTHADLGLPMAASEHFRFAKRVVSRICWPFLRHQVAFNHAVLQSNRELVVQITRLQERIDQGLRNDLLDFADRSASQAHAEISNYVAEARSVNAGLILELRSLQAELNTMVETLSRVLPSHGVTAGLEGQQDAVQIEGGTHESHR